MYNIMIGIAQLCLSALLKRQISVYITLGMWQQEQRQIKCVTGMFLFLLMHWTHRIEDTNTEVDVYNYLFNLSIVKTLLQSNIILRQPCWRQRDFKKDSLTIETTISTNINETLNSMWSSITH